jgi:hypothetical protein
MLNFQLILHKNKYSQFLKNQSFTGHPIPEVTPDWLLFEAGPADISGTSILPAQKTSLYGFFWSDSQRL